MVSVDVDVSAVVDDSEEVEEVDDSIEVVEGVEVSTQPSFLKLLVSFHTFSSLSRASGGC